MLNRHRNFNIAGEVGCISLLALASILVNPVIGSSASALESSGESGGGVRSEGIGADSSSSDTAIMPLAATTSTVNIAFNPKSVNGTVTPVDTVNGSRAKVEVQATVRVQNSGGYDVYIGSNSSQLKNGEHAIDSIGENETYAYTDLPVNKWGYSFSKTTTAADSYEALPSSLYSKAVDSNKSESILDETRNYTLSFAVNIGSDKSAGVYSNQVTMSVVSSPRELTQLSEITDMQQMTTKVCNNASVGDSKQLRDTRDGKYYWITKLADGNCWMTQNLDLDLNYSLAGANESTGVLLTPETSDVKENWIPSSAKSTVADYTDKNLFEPTTNIADANTILPDNLGLRSWSLGDYILTDPAQNWNCGGGKKDLSECTEAEVGGQKMLAPYSTPLTANNDESAHKIFGNSYQWNTATAGTGETITDGQAADSICPKGWKMPSFNNSDSGSFEGLLNAYSIGSDVIKLTSAPLYFVRCGGVGQLANGFLTEVGFSGTYWYSTRIPDALSLYHLQFWGDETILPAYPLIVVDGYSIRCLAR